MSDSREIRIRVLTGASGAWLGLEGSILSYRERHWNRETLVDIPVELATFSECKRFDGSRLIAALLSLLFLPALGAAFHAAWTFVVGPISDSVLLAFVGMTALVTFVAFLVLLGRFLMRRAAITIHVAPGDLALTFWLDEKIAPAILNLVDEVAARQSAVAETMPFPMRQAIGDTIGPPWKRLLGMTFLFLVPALVTEIPWLLLFGLIPLGFHGHWLLAQSRQPREYRQAARHFFKREWSQALDLVRELHRQRPEHLPARLFEIELLMRVEDFTGAEAALASVHGELDSDTLQSIQQDIILRRRLLERKRE